MDSACADTILTFVSPISPDMNTNKTSFVPDKYQNFWPTAAKQFVRIDNYRQFPDK